MSMHEVDAPEILENNADDQRNTFQVFGETIANTNNAPYPPISDWETQL